MTPVSISDRQTDKQTDGRTDTPTERHADGQTDRKGDRQARAALTSERLRSMIAVTQPASRRPCRMMSPSLTWLLNDLIFLSTDPAEDSWIFRGRVGGVS